MLSSFSSSFLCNSSIITGTGTAHSATHTQAHGLEACKRHPHPLAPRASTARCPPPPSIVLLHDAFYGEGIMNLEGETLLAAFIARSWPRLRAEFVFFLPNHLPGVDAGRKRIRRRARLVFVELLLSGEGVSCLVRVAIKVLSDDAITLSLLRGERSWIDSFRHFWLPGSQQTSCRDASASCSRLLHVARVGRCVDGA